MTDSEFYKELTKERKVYSIFNSVCENLFYQLAVSSRMPIPRKKLDDILFEDKYLSTRQSELIKGSFSENARFREYTSISDMICIRYFVNINDEIPETNSVALHLQEYLNPPVNKVDTVSTIILFENHPFKVLEHKKYPKIIKHELAHVAIEFMVHGQPELEQFYFNEENGEFIEFLCDIMQYLSNPSKKENGIVKFIDDSVECFGYNASIDKADYLRMIDTAEESNTEE